MLTSLAIILTPLIVCAVMAYRDGCENRDAAEAHREFKRAHREECEALGIDPEE